MDLAERLAEYASGLSYSDLERDGRVLAEAKKRILDAVGCGVGAFGAAPVKAARRLAVEGYPAKSSTVLGTRRKTTPDVAALVNGLMVRYFDFNDTYLSREPAHPSDNTPACLAVAEMEGRSGKDILVAVVLAYEVQCRLCDAANLRHRGWDHVNYGLVSVALAAGKLMRLSGEEMAQAVNISLNSHLAMRQVRAGAISEWKGFSFANAARNAVFSARLAREGIRGPSPIFEGEMGFFNQVSGRFQADTRNFGGRDGKFKLSETSIKFFPAEYHAQSAIWAALALRKSLGAEGLAKVSVVGVETSEAGYTILGKDDEKWAPETRETADHSIPYIVAAALLDGGVDEASFAPKKFRDPARRELMKKVVVAEDKTMTMGYPGSISCRVTVKLEDGRTLKEQVDDPRGHPMNPMTDEEVGAKFVELTEGLLTAGQADKVRDIVANFERWDASALMGACVVKA